MILFLLFDGSCKRTTSFSIDLKTCVPFAGIYKGGKIAITDFFKVLVLDSILVDCDRREISWSCNRFGIDMLYRGSEDEIDTEKVLDNFRSKGTLFTPGPIFDVLFEKAERIFQHLSPVIFEKDGNASTYGILIEILHVYILPEIKFQTEHREAMENVFEKIKAEFRNIEKIIEKSVQTLSDYEKSLAKQRKYLIEPESVATILSKVPMDLDFINMLLKHIEKDIQKLDGGLILLTDKIDAIRTSKDETHVTILADTRADRDKVSREKESIITAREELKHGILTGQVLYERKAKKSVFNRLKSKADRTGAFYNNCEKYKLEAANIESLSSDIRQQINIKIRLTSVKESLISVLEDSQTCK